MEAAAAFGEAVRRAFADEDAPVVGADLQSRAEAAFEAWLGRAPAVAWDAHRRVHEVLRTAEALHVTPTHLRYGVPTLRAASIRVAKLFALAPVAVPGWILHVPPYQAVAALARRLRVREEGQDLDSTVKVLASMLFFPVWWVMVAAAVAGLAGPIWGAGTLAALPVTGRVALRFAELVSDTGDHVAVLWSALLRRRRLVRLRAMQVALGEQLVVLERLPGSAADDGAA